MEALDIQPWYDPFPADRCSCDFGLQFMSPQRRVCRDCHDLRRMPPAAVQYGGEPQSCRRRLPDRLPDVPQHHGLVTFFVESRQLFPDQWVPTTHPAGGRPVLTVTRFRRTIRHSRALLVTTIASRSWVPNTQGSPDTHLTAMPVTDVIHEEEEIEDFGSVAASPDRLCGGKRAGPDRKNDQGGSITYVSSGSIYLDAVATRDWLREIQ